MKENCGKVKKIISDGSILVDIPITPGDSGGPLYAKEKGLIGFTNYGYGKETNMISENTIATPIDGQDFLGKVTNETVERRYGGLQESCENIFSGMGKAHGSSAETADGFGKFMGFLLSILAFIADGIYAIIAQFVPGAKFDGLSSAVK